MPITNSQGEATGGDFRCTYHGTITTIEPLRRWLIDQTALGREANHG